MRTNLVIAASTLALLGGCATAAPQIDITPVQRSSAMTPQTAETFAVRGMYAEAALAYRSILQANADDASARFGFAEALRKGGKPVEAKAEYEKLLPVEEWKLRALEGVGEASLASGDRDGASEAFTQVTDEDAKAWKSWLGLAQLHDLDKEWDKADVAYAAALANTNQPAIVYNNQGLSRLARGKPEWAAEHFRLALASDPTLTRARTNLELAEAAAGVSLERVNASERDSRERARKLNNAGYVAMLQNRPEEARAFYQAALEAYPSFYAQAFQNLQTLDAARPRNITPHAE